MRNTQLNGVSYWQYLVIAITLVILTINALPTFYGKSDVLVVQKHPTTQQQLDQTLAPAFFNQQQKKVQVVKESNIQQTLIVRDGTDISLLKQPLKAFLGKDYQVVLSQYDNSPSWLKQLGAKGIKLGLDLSGGVLFVLEVDVNLALQERLEGIQQQLKNQLREDKMYGARVEVGDNHTIDVLYRPSQHTATKYSVKQVMQKNPELDISQTNENAVILSFNPSQKIIFERQIMQQAISTMRNRIEQLGITEAVTQRQGKNRIRIEIPGVKDPQEAQRVIGATATLDFYQMATSTGHGKTFQTKQGVKMELAYPAILGGSNIQYAGAGRDEYGKALVNIHLDDLGGNKMSAFSNKNIGKPIVTVYSEYQKDAQGNLQKVSEIINSAKVLTQLSNRFSITNLDSKQQADELAMLIRAGSLNAPVSIVEQRTIGPSLGAENIQNGLLALASGLVMTLLFMLLWYRKLGAIANIALFFNLSCLLGLMALLPNAVLTLPGIAGLVLTIGMAVDTNVLIFERIKEELGQCKNSRIAVIRGYDKAFSSIFDANVTTLLTGLVLLSIGYGPVKGFAITLCLGLLTSIFTGVFVSRALTYLFSIDGFEWRTGVDQ